MRHAGSTGSHSSHVAVLKSANYRSRGLLTKLGFMQASPEEAALFECDSDEVVMIATPSRLRDRRAADTV